MVANPTSAPPPKLRIVPLDAVLPHEKSDLQRSEPLIRRLRRAEFFTNPPVVARAGADHYVLMDGANRYHSLKHLGFEHILAQIADYETEFVELGVWQHIVSDWNRADFLRGLRRIDGVQLRAGGDENEKALARIQLRGGPTYSVEAAAMDIGQRNAALRQVVDVYHQQAVLYRTALSDPAQIWPLYPAGLALVIFPTYQPSAIIEAALNQAYLPPGISRHIIHGRALRLNYPMSRLRDDLPLEQKNDQLQEWMRQKLAERGLRYYAEATYQFDE